MANILELKNITKTFDNEVILDNMNLYIRDKEFLTLLGPSGCGKTTTLRIIAGFETPSSGNVFFEGKDISSIPPYERNINTVFQNYALFPHLNVYDNIVFVLKIKKMDKSTINNKVLEVLRLVNLKGFENRKIHRLSGGQQQRVAIARALVNEPKILLLDESLESLDSKLKKEMQMELKRIQKRVGITFIYVTHDQEEALIMSDTVVVMDKGLIQQIGTPIDIYNEPKNRFVAEFIGESNILEGIFNKDFSVTFSGKEFICVDKGFEKDEKVEVVIRPEDVEIVDEFSGQLKGKVESIIFKGVHYEMMVNTGDFIYKVHSTLKREVSDNVGIKIIPDNIHIMRKKI